MTPFLSAQGFINFFADDQMLYIASLWRDRVMLRVYSEKGEGIEMYPLRFSPSNVCRPLVDGDTVYLTDQNGNTWGLDKYSGETVVQLDTGYSIPTHLHVADDKIIALITLPLSTNKKQIQTKTILAMDIATGRRLVQTRSFNETSGLSVHDRIYVTADKQLCAFTLQGEADYRVDTGGQRSPLVVGDTILVSSSTGLINVHDRQTGLSLTKILGYRTPFPLVCLDGRVYCPTTDSVYLVNHRETKVQETGTYNVSLDLPPVATRTAFHLLDKDKIVSINSDGVPTVYQHSAEITADATTTVIGDSVFIHAGGNIWKHTTT